MGKVVFGPATKLAMIKSSKLKVKASKKPANIGWQRVGAASLEQRYPRVWHTNHWTRRPEELVHAGYTRPDDDQHNAHGKKGDAARMMVYNPRLKRGAGYRHSIAKKSE